MKDILIAIVAVLGLVAFSYMRRGEVCLAPGLVLAVIFPFIVLVLEWRLHAVVWDDVWRRFEKAAGPVDKVVEGVLEEAGIPFERLGPWQGFRSFKYRFSERYLLPDGTRISIREHDEPILYVGPAAMVEEVERLKDLLDDAFG
jgi:hypothetical protein